MKLVFFRKVCYVIKPTMLLLNTVHLYNFVVFKAHLYMVLIFITTLRFTVANSVTPFLQMRKLKFKNEFYYFTFV